MQPRDFLGVRKLLAHGDGEALGELENAVLHGTQRLAAPIVGDMAKQAVLNLVPLASPGWEVTDPDPQTDLVGELLQLVLPST
jgi:hypothetical protein